MEDIAYLSVMAVAGTKIAYDGVSAIKWKPEGRKEVYRCDLIELDSVYEETEEYFQNLEQRKYELNQKFGLTGTLWSEVEKVLSNPVKHAKNTGRKEALDRKKERFEERKTIQESR